MFPCRAILPRRFVYWSPCEPRRVPTAEISYRVGDANATLVVSKIPMEGDGRHQFVKSGSYHGSSFQSWTMRGQMYTIASADAKVGCLCAIARELPDQRELIT